MLILHIIEQTLGIAHINAYIVEISSREGLSLPLLIQAIFSFRFPRSDLLARHVNKCHANEKQIPAVNANRRKGSASASRATTSKQACDQCVQSSLPCDGCNPCAKCVQRKCRCTYVKFHRQTAPTGPGHNPRPVSAHSRLATQPHADDFILGPPPMSVPSMSATDSYAHTFNFPHIYPPSEHQLSNLPDGSDFAAKYRAQAELLRRDGTPIAPTNGSAPSGVVPGLYTDPDATTSWFGWGQDGSTHPNMSTGQIGYTNESILADRYILNESRGQLSGLSGPNADTYAGGMPGYGRQRRESVDFGSDGSSTSHSAVSSASSSNIHLPLDTSARQQQMTYHVGTGDYRQFPQLIASQQDINHSRHDTEHYPLHHDLRHSASHPNLQNHEGGFSSAFGLMSIDDPNVIAGLAADGAPFFSNAAMNMAPQDPNVTPMPNKQPRDSNGISTSLTTPGLAREAETRELRDFWKQYMQTPLTGPGSSALDAAAQVGFYPNQRSPASPNGSRRVRVSSLPSAQTPSSDIAGNVNGGRAPARGANGTSSIRTTLHGNTDDLRSYEAAVLARKTPTLHLVPRKGRGSMNAASASPPNAPSRTNVNSLAPATNQNHFTGRPSSSSSTSSLANALDRPSHLTSRVDQASGSSASFARPPSRESLSESATSDRPSFKRLSSQTLGPAKAKRALLSTEADNADVPAVGSNIHAMNIGKGLSGLHSATANYHR
ncbi:hypothetical protein PILCRDRAFT_15339 [Piloderma croceum F 1598]|uniref:Zn(2)-C6 fungal-type domain-containing protein n=1 Tax=Piloderma croceum (strain F 1598) TaxID=765440 RepID=A0A0C3EZF1_PILCF|nr:hypothetical protein PILCRDRAFT_15339 [Piloderma croceum F 1598]